MQFQIPIDVYSHVMFFYLGKGEAEAFSKDICAEEEDVTGDFEGLTCENHIWVREGDDINVVVHEISHAVDDLIKVHGLPEHTEVRAYLMGYIVSEYYGKLMNNKPKEVEVTEPEEWYDR